MKNEHHVLVKSCNRDQGLAKVCEGSESIHVNSTTKGTTSALSPWFSRETTNIKGHKTFFFFFLLQAVFRILDLSKIFLCLFYVYSFLDLSSFLFSPSASFCPAVPYHVLPHSTCGICL